jgi:energy-coupling factor transport system permease protein
MLKDITIGQYISGDSVIHKLDPRTKFINTFIYMILLFIAGTFTEFSMLMLFLIAVIYISKISFKFILKAVKPIFIFILITVVLNVFMTPGAHIIFKFGFLKITSEGLYFASITCIRLIMLIIGASMLTYTTSPLEITDGMESIMKPLKKVHVPVHEIAMMMSIALRFIPTLIDETDKIMKAQKSRGADIDSGKFRDRIKAVIPVLVPLFINSFKRADELAIAMESRCYRGSEGRTKMKQLKYSKIDFYSYGIILLLVLALVIIKIYFI